MTDIYDEFGQKYMVMNTADVKELSGDGGPYGLDRTEVTITINDEFEINFALHVKYPALLYINGKPCVPGTMYMTTGFSDGYTYGVYFERLEYDMPTIRKELKFVRTTKVKLAKCLPYL